MSDLTLPSRLRLERAHSLDLALADAHPEDAQAIAAAFLENAAAGMPGLAPFADIRADARFWAGAASVVELVEYCAAAAQELSGKLLGIHARKRLLWQLWRSLPPKVQADFLRFAGREGA